MVSRRKPEGRAGKDPAFFIAAVLAGAFCLLSLPAEAAGAAAGGTFEIDAAHSSLEVDVARGGFFKALGHDHVIAARDLAGRVRFDPGHPETSSVTLRVASASLKVADPEISEKDRAEVQATLLGAEVLDAVRFPEIAFDSGRVALRPERSLQPGTPGPADPGNGLPRREDPDPPGPPALPAASSPSIPGETWNLTLTGILHLHGVEKKISFPVALRIDGNDLEAAGEVSLLQSDYGITPVKAGGGLVKVKDRLRIRFAIRARSAPS